MHGYVAGIKRYMIHDGPGIRTTVFLKGCPLRCLWCSSPQTWSLEPRIIYRWRSCIRCLQCVQVCPAGALAPAGGTAGEPPGAGADPDGPGISIDRERCTGCGRCADVCPSGALTMDGSRISSEQVVDAVKKDLPYYRKSGGGVTLSGGEPTVQAGFLVEILKGCRREGIHTAVETTGCAEWEVMQRILPLVDLLLYDIKHMDPGRHAELTGRDNELILRNLEKACREDHVPIVVHVPLVPGCNDDRANLDALLDYLEGLGLKKLGVLPFHKLGLHEYEELGITCSLEDRPVPGREHIRGMVEHIRTRGFEVIHW